MLQCVRCNAFVAMLIFAEDAKAPDRDITLIITPIVSVLLLVKYIRELRKITLVNATAEDIAQYVVNPIVKEIEKAERERMEQELKHRISYERENFTKELEVQNSRAKLEKLYESRE